jgi:hypothetical protein
LTALFLQDVALFSYIVIQVYLLSLVNHPEVQENIRIEFTENTSEDCPSQLSEKSHFSYCEVVMAESQRLGFFTLQCSPFKTMNIVICPSLYTNLPRENGSMFSIP